MFSNTAPNGVRRLQQTRSPIKVAKGTGLASTDILDVAAAMVERGWSLVDIQPDKNARTGRVYGRFYFEVPDDLVLPERRGPVYGAPDGQSYPQQWGRDLNDGKIHGNMLVHARVRRNLKHQVAVMFPDSGQGLPFDPTGVLKAREPRELSRPPITLRDGDGLACTDYLDVASALSERGWKRVAIEGDRNPETNKVYGRFVFEIPEDVADAEQWGYDLDAGFVTGNMLTHARLRRELKDLCNEQFDPEARYVKE